ncbi:acyl-CoA dehydrogenase/oxidase [Sporodiniella umbellata]|nr:acyl-CoA dehydrogenase/oxidase [Sporodiniella umbellata]
MSRQAPKDMARERSASEFDIQKLSEFWAGGEKQYSLLQKSYDFIKQDSELVVQPPRNFLELSRDEMREFTMGQIYRCTQILKEVDDQEYSQEILRAVNVYSESFSMRFFVHWSLFRNVVCMLGNEEQQGRYVDDVDNFRIFGCFAMTELGHSSALRDIETTATYDKTTDQFIVDSPTITSTKCWIGMSAQTATHAVVIAQTVIGGESVGLNWFVVQLRSTITGELEPDIQIGDMGQKVGHEGVDNGWIQFRQKRIPRTDMLAKWVSLDREGVYEPAPNPALMYATLIPERLSLTTVTTQLISRAVTIATRYSVVRRQGAENQQIMDYQSHYVKLVPAIAFLYVVQASSDVLNSQFDILTAGGKMEPMDYLNHMGDLHAISASLKGLTGWYGSEILEICRRSCGGHAYSAYNCIGHIIGEWGVMTTGGGDNVVLLQQAASYLVSRLEKQLQFDQYPDFKFKSSIDYIRNAKQYVATKAWSVTDVNQIKDSKVLLDAVYTILIHTISKKRKIVKREELILESTRVSELHCAAFMLSVAIDRFASAQIDKNVALILQKLAHLWGLHVLYTYSEEGFKEDYLTSAHIKNITEAYFETCKSIRTQVIGLTDAFGFPDFILKAPIAKYDGDIYPTYLETMMLAPGSTGVPSYHAKYIKPLTSRKNPNLAKK